MLYRPRLLYISFVLLVVVITIGVLGYMLISGDNFIDSLYMTIITMTTVGFGEIHPLTDNEKVFTIFLIMISIVSYGFSVTALTEYIMNGRILQKLKIRKVHQKIQHLKNHAVVCGYGRNGRQAVEKLSMYNMPCVVIEKRKEMIADLESHDIWCIEGDATDDEALKKAAIENATSLITALPSDADNLFVVLSARQLNENMTIISRASNESSYKKLKIAGATNVIMPDYIGGMHMASLVVTPDLVEFVDRLTILDEGTPNLEEIDINKLPKQFINKTILDLDLRNSTGCTVIGFKTAEDEYIINPEPTMRLEKDCNLIVIGKADQIQKIHKIF